MADPTTNFAWDVPEVGGSNNAWGSQLNLVFDDIDADLKTVKDTADAAAADIVDIQAAITGLSGQQTLMLGFPAFQARQDEDDVTYGADGDKYVTSDFTDSPEFWATFALPIGATLDQVDLICDKNGNVSVTVTVYKQPIAGGGLTSLGTGTRSAAGVGAASAAAIAHVVTATEFLLLRTTASILLSQRYRVYGAKILWTPAAV